MHNNYRSFTNLFQSGFTNSHNFLGMPAELSSYHSLTIYPADYGNDGNEDTFFHTAVNDPGAWWRVDLGSIYCIHSVNLVNRNDGTGAICLLNL